MAEDSTRRVGRGSFLRLATAAAAAAVPACSPGTGGNGAASPSPGASSAPYGALRYFDSTEANTIVAMAERIFPADENGPGATDLHVVEFIDRRLAGAYGYAAKTYKAGPWPKPVTSGHGWQLPVLPRDMYRQALVDIDAHCQKIYNNAFAALPAGQQDDVLGLLEKGQVQTFTAVPADQFFTIFIGDVTRGLFADPMYGGNHNKGGWAFLGFPGDPMAYGDRYAELVTQYDKAYNVTPMALGERGSTS